MLASRGVKRLELRCSTFVGDPLRKAEGELLQAQLAEAGIQLRLVNTNSTTLFGEWLPEGNFDIADFAWIGIPFAISGNQDIYRTGSGSNFGKFSDLTVDALFQQASVSWTRSGRPRSATKSTSGSGPSSP